MKERTYWYTKQEIEEIAGIIVDRLKEKGITPPYTLEKLKEIANKLGIEVIEGNFGYRFNNYDDKGNLVFSEDAFPFEGQLEIKKENGRERITIILNKDRPVYEPRRAHFTFAHELGHYFLHYKLLGLEIIPKDTFYTFNRKTSYDRREREANWFASAFLMPAKDVREQWEKLKEKHCGKPDAFIFVKAITELADHFKVSKLAMRYRLQEIGLIK